MPEDRRTDDGEKFLVEEGSQEIQDAPADASKVPSV